jgi:hypothetical protein
MKQQHGTEPRQRRAYARSASSCRACTQQACRPHRASVRRPESSPTAPAGLLVAWWSAYKLASARAPAARASLYSPLSRASHSRATNHTTGPCRSLASLVQGIKQARGQPSSSMAKASSRLLFSLSLVVLLLLVEVRADTVEIV